ncbi:MAG TPA: WD40 repeat domain-containing protein [Candidatus Sulfotelmatobacter sp.]
MHRWFLFKSHAARLAGTILTLLLILSFLPACGGSKPPGASPFPGTILLAPANSTSVQLGSILTFTASAQNAGGTSISAAFTYQSSDTSILNIAPNGVACAGIWDAAFVNCTPGSYGVVQVTASALGATSLPTLVYVHPPIDSIQISVVAPVNQPPPACPGQQTIPVACAHEFTSTTSACLSANQSMTLQARAFNKGTDITSSVGPFTWSETSTSAVKVTPLVTDNNTNIATNQATVTPNTPGFTPVFAAAANVSSQPYYAETCPVQCIALDMGDTLSGITSFSVNKSNAQTIYATAVDVQGCVVPNPPLTWSSTAPAAVVPGSAGGCAAGTSCTLTTQQPGSASITASCTPPTCNVGFPQNVAALLQPLIQPFPVYPVTAVSGLVTGAPSATNVLATTHDCFGTVSCTTGLYDISTSTNQSGGATQLPAPINSLLFDPAGDKAYAGGNFGSLVINPTNIGTSNSAFTGLNIVTGTVLAISSNGNLAIFSDTAHTPNNQVFVVNTTTASSPSAAILKITGASAAAFSPDGLKAFILGQTGPTCTSSAGCLYIFSPIQALQTIPLSAPATAITFSSSGAFAFVTGGSSTSSIAVFNTCDNSSNPLAITLPAAPLFLKTLPPEIAPSPIGSAGLKPTCTTLPTTPPTYQCVGLDVLVGLDSTGLDLIATSASQPTFPASCPQPLAIASNSVTTLPFPPQHINLGQGTFTPMNFFLSPDATAAYIVASDRSDILVYNFTTNATTGIPLVGFNGASVSPVAASISTDGTLIYVAASDGELHEVNTTTGQDLVQIPFPSLPNTTNPFCLNVGSTIDCTLDLVAVKP